MVLPEFSASKKGPWVDSWKMEKSSPRMKSWIFPCSRNRDRYFRLSVRMRPPCPGRAVAVNDLQHGAAQGLTVGELKGQPLDGLIHQGFSSFQIDLSQEGLCLSSGHVSCHRSSGTAPGRSQKSFGHPDRRRHPSSAQGGTALSRWGGCHAAWPRSPCMHPRRCRKGPAPV